MTGQDRPSNRWIAAVCLIVVAVVVLAVIMANARPPKAGTIPFELRKYVIQFLLIVALGAVVAFSVDVLKRRAENDEERRRAGREQAERERQYDIDTVTSLLDRLDASYAAVKRTRQSFRLVHRAALSRQAYLDAMLVLSDEKRDVEKIGKDIEVLEGWLPELEPLWLNVTSMEKYLNELEHEWEKVGSSSEAEFDARSLDALARFSAKWSDAVSDFERFRGPYYAARSELMTLLARKRTEARESTFN